MTERRSTTSEFELRKATDGDRMIVGHAAVFNQETRIGSEKYGFIEVIRPGAFAETMKENRDILALVEHDSGRLLGRTVSGTLRLWEDDRGLAFEIDIPNTTDGNDVTELLRRGDLGKMSFAFSPRNAGEVLTTKEDGTPLRILTAVDLYEVSVISQPAYEDTDAALRGKLAALVTAKSINVDARREMILRTMKRKG